jgi:hypothetical protein
VAGREAALSDRGLPRDLETHGRKRLLPHLADVPVGAISEQHIRTGWLR